MTCSSTSLGHDLGCNTVYYKNYLVKKGMRHYYDGDMPNIIQVAEHRYVECWLINMWTTDMNIAWWIEALMLLSLFNMPLTGSWLPTVHKHMKLLLLGLIASQLAGLSKRHLKKIMFKIDLSLFPFLKTIMNTIQLSLYLILESRPIVLQSLLKLGVVIPNSMGNGNFFTDASCVYVYIRMCKGMVHLVFILLIRAIT